MRRTTLGPVNASALNARSSMGAPPARAPRASLAFKPSDDRRASAFPSLGGRRSTQGRPPKSRSSVAYNARGVRQDPRPLSDRQYMGAAIRNLIAFLIERGYDQPLSMKILSNPSSRDFQSIFMFLLNLVDPAFRAAARRDVNKHTTVPVRFEDEVPVLLRCLGYPFSVSKSALSAVGSPHAWPQLLGVLSWLMGLIRYDEQLQARHDSDVALEPHARRDNIFYDNTVQAYAQFLQGADTFPDLDKALDDHFAAENDNREEEIAKLDNDRDQLAETLRALRTQPSPLQLINEHKISLETNIRKFKLLIPSLLEHGASVRKKIAEKDAEIQREQTELAQLAEEKARLADVLARQEEAAIDVERIAADRDQLREALHQLAAERAAAESDQKEAEQMVAAASAALSDSLKIYHRELEKLGLLGGGNGQMRRRSTSNTDCSVTVSRDATFTDPNKILSVNIAKDVLPKIHVLKEAFVSRVPALQEESLKLQEQVDEVEERLIVLRHDLSLVESRKSKLEAEYQAKKEAMMEQLQRRSEAIIQKEEDISKTRERLQESVREKERKIAALTSELHSFEEQFNREGQRIAAMTKRDIKLFKEHQQKVRRSVLEVKNHFEEESARTAAT